MHWCMDETLAVLALLPVIGFFFRKLHTWWHKQSHHKCHEQGCNDTHVEHCHMPANIPHGKVGEGQCEQHPLIVHDEGPEPEIWTPLTQETVEAKFGKELVQDLYNVLWDAGMVELQDGEMLWLVNESNELQVEVRFRTFIHGYNQCEHGWDEVKDDTGSCCQGLGQE